MQGPTIVSRRTAAAPVRKVRVSVVSGPDSGQSVEDDSVSVGTAADNRLVLTDPTVSRYHVELHRSEGGVHVRDLGSLNGTHVGAIVLADAVLQPGSRIQIGDSLLVLEDGGETATDDSDADVPAIVGTSPAMQRVKRLILQLARSQVSTLIEGETGTGKELVARALHDHGPRAGAPFVTVDCASVPATVIASELFGHERGAFTSADRQRVGAFEEAHGGTVFLDEIGELPIAVQPVLLGALERRRFRRVGGSKDIHVDVRVVAATNRDLREEVNQGSYRADLYYRLAVAKIKLPPLRDRPEDVDPLVRRFVLEALGTTDPFPFGPGTMQQLAAHPWGGNVRELRNVVEGALALGQLHLPDDGGGAAPAGPGDAAGANAAGPIEVYKTARQRAMDQFESVYLSALIARCEGNASMASREAKMDRSHLLSLLKKHGLR